MSNVIGSGLDKLKEVADKCKRQQGTLAIRTKFVGLDDDQVRVMCYGGEDLPTGIIEDISPEAIEEIRKQVELLGKDVIKVLEELFSDFAEDDIVKAIDD